MIQGIGDRGAVPLRVVPVGGDVVLRVGDRGDQPCRSVRHRGDVVQRVGDRNQLALRVVSEMRDARGCTAIRCGRRYGKQVSTRIIRIRGDVPQRIGDRQHFAEAVVRVGGRRRRVRVQLHGFRQ